MEPQDAGPGAVPWRTTTVHALDPITTIAMTGAILFIVMAQVSLAACGLTLLRAFHSEDLLLARAGAVGAVLFDLLGFTFIALAAASTPPMRTAPASEALMFCCIGLSLPSGTALRGIILYRRSLRRPNPPPVVDPAP